MTKIFSALLILAMIVQIIRPIGLPGLKKRGDFWKIAVVALLLFGLTVAVSSQ